MNIDPQEEDTHPGRSFTPAPSTVRPSALAVVAAVGRLVGAIEAAGLSVPEELDKLRVRYAPRRKPSGELAAVVDGHLFPERGEVDR
jgi:hypothetical protein